MRAKNAQKKCLANRDKIKYIRTASQITEEYPI